jgi:hypothetical protein
MAKFILVLVAASILGFVLGVVFLDFSIPSSSALITNPSSFLHLLQNQQVGIFWLNPLKYAIRGVISAGVPANTVVLLLLLTVVAAFIAGVRNIVGLRSFGIFLPAALSVVFVAIGPFMGIGLFLLIVGISTLIRILLRKTKVRLQYLPRMAFILWAVVLTVIGVLFVAPLIVQTDFSNISIFPVFILVFLAEDFIRVQTGKSVNTAINLTTETLILGLSSYLILSFKPLQEASLLHPEILLISVALFDFLLGKYVGLRFLEYWRFRKLITQ